MAAQIRSVKRVELNFDQKREICLFAKDNPTYKQDQIRVYFSKKFQITLKKSFISNTLSNSQKICDLADSSVNLRNRSSKYPKLEETLFTWYTEMRNFNGVLT